jgi:hypothetical protein
MVHSPKSSPRSHSPYFSILTSSTRLLRNACSIVLIALSTLTPAATAHAQTVTQADAVYDGWLKAYLVKSGSQTYFVNSSTDRSMAFMWGQAYMITGVEDAYDFEHRADQKQLVLDLLNTFEKEERPGPLLG